MKEDKKEALKWIRKAAEQGDMDAQFLLGVCYSGYEGIPENKTEAVKWFRAAAGQGSEEAQAVLDDLGVK